MHKYLKLGKTTAIECLEYYCSDIIECFGDEFTSRRSYLRRCWVKPPRHRPSEPREHDPIAIRQCCRVAVLPRWSSKSTSRADRSAPPPRCRVRAATSHTSASCRTPFPFTTPPPPAAPPWATASTPPSRRGSPASAPRPAAVTWAAPQPQQARPTSGPRALPVAKAACRAKRTARPWPRARLRPRAVPWF
jgi:hypothetical protein